MSLLLNEFSFILVFLFLALFLAFFIFLASYVFASHIEDSEKLSPYECGFDPFDDARNEFDIRFYLVAILFLIFDLEASFLFPWATNLFALSSNSFWFIVDFLLELIVGFVYVWKVGALEWE